MHERLQILKALKQERRLPTEKKIFPEEGALIMQMTDPVPERRPSVEDILRSDEFNGWMNCCQLDLSKEDA